MTGGHIAVIVALILLLCVFVSASSEGFRGGRAVYGPWRWRGYGGNGIFPRGPMWGRPANWTPRGYRAYNWGPSYTAGYYDLAYRRPIYIETPKDVAVSRPGLLWCGTSRCSAEETVPETGSKDELKPCPSQYNDNGFKEYNKNMLGLGLSRYRRVCELANPNM